MIFVNPLEFDAFCILRTNAQNSLNSSSDLSIKYIEKLLSLLIIFKPNYHFIFNQYYIDIITILKIQKNPIKCLEIMYKILKISEKQNEKSFISLIEPFIPKISNNAPKFLQKQYQILLILIMMKINKIMKCKN